MVEAEVPRPRTLLVVFGSYVGLEVGFTALFARRLVSESYPAAATAQILAVYLVLAASSLVVICIGALWVEAHLDAHLAELERLPLLEATEGAERRPAADPEGADLDPDTVLLLASLQELGLEAEDTARKAVASPLPVGWTPRTPPESRGVSAGDLARAREAHESILSYLAGPLVTSLALIAVPAALLPASDGLLQANPALNAFIVLAGMESLFGLAVYLAATFRALLRAGEALPHAASHGGVKGPAGLDDARGLADDPRLRHPAGGRISAR